MRRYYLASSRDRDDVDLRDYRETIEEAVRKYMPNAKVEVCERYYDRLQHPRSPAVRNRELRR